MYDSVESDPSNRDGSTRARLDTPPPRPPGNSQKRSVLSMASGSDQSALGMDASNPAIQVMKSMGVIKQEFLKMAALMPNYAQGFQQIVASLDQVVPQGVADLVSGNPAGTSGSGIGAQGANMAPTAPPTQTGIQ